MSKPLLDRLDGRPVSSASVLLVVAILVSMLSSCLGPMGLPEYGELVVDLSAPPAARNIIESATPSFVASFELTIEGDDMATISEEAPADQARFAVSVPAGTDRKLTLNARNAAGVELYRGEASVTVEAGKTIPVALEMAVRFATELPSLRLEHASNPGLYTAAPTGGPVAYAEKDIVAAATAGGFDFSVFWFADVTSLAPSFDLGAGASLAVSGNAQESGVSTHDFGSPVQYDLSTADGQTTPYTVSVWKSADMSPLLIDIASAEVLHNGATEGTAVGEYPAPAKSAFLAAIDSAKAVAVDMTTDSAALTAAVADLANARAAFDAARVLGPANLGTFEFLAAANSELNNATYTSLAAGQDANGVVTASGATGTVDVLVWWYTDRTNLVPEFTTGAGATVTVGGVTQQSGVTPQDFVGSETTPVIYRVTDSTGTTSVDYSVTVRRSADFSTLLDDILSAEALHAGAVEGSQPGEYPAPAKGNLQTAIDAARVVAADITSDAGSITTAQSDLAAAVGVFDSARVLGASDFASFEFSSSNNPGLIGAPAPYDAISGLTMNAPATFTDTVSDQNIDVTLWWFTPAAEIQALVPTFAASSGATVSVSAVDQTSGVSSQDFTDSDVTPVQYVVTDSTGTVSTPYTVSVYLSQDFSTLLDQIQIAEVEYAAAVEGTLPGEYPAPAKSDLLAAINSAKGVANNISAPATEITTARDTLAAAVTTFQSAVMGPMITSFDLSASINTTLNHASDPLLSSGQDAVGVITDTGIDGGTVDLAVWWYANLTNLIPSFTVNPAATVEVVGVPQTSGVDGADFSLGSVSYTLNATGDAGIRTYAVTVTPSEDFSPLLNEIQNAKSIESGAVEGYNAGEFVPGSKSVFSAEIANAEAFVTTANIDATLGEIATAVSDLQAAVSAFQSAEITTAELIVGIDWTAPTDAGISFSGGVPTLTTSGSMMITANLAGAGAYRWYVDGIDTGESTATISMHEADLIALGTHTVGPHTVTVMVTGADGLDYSAEFDFEMVNDTLSDADSVAADAAALAIQFASADSAGAITRDVALQTTGPNGSSITWDAVGHQWIDALGRVTRPRLIDGGLTGDLVATITKGAATDSVTFSGLRVVPRGEQRLQDPDLGNTQGFGRVIDQTDSHLIVGVPDDDAGGTNAGKVVIYEWSAATGEWANPFEVLGSQAGARFGSAVAIDGDFAVVGAPFYDDTASAETNEGGAFVYVRSGPGNAWTTDPLAQLRPDEMGAYDGYTGGEFGRAVGISMPYIAVGAPASGGASKAAPDGSGRVYLYEQVGVANRWDGPGYRVAARNGTNGNAVAGARFGGAVAIHRDILVVGAPDEEVSVEAGAGRAYIYSRAANGNDWLTNATVDIDATLGPDGPQAGAGFGSAVDVVDDTTDWVAVGAPGATEVGGATIGAGAAFVFDGGGTYQSAFTPSGGSGIQSFGSAVALRMSGLYGELVAGANRSNLAASLAGHAFVYSNTSGSWVETVRFVSDFTAGSDQFGTSITVSPHGKVSVGSSTHVVDSYE